MEGSDSILFLCEDQREILGPWQEVYEAAHSIQRAKGSTKKILKQESEEYTITKLYNFYWLRPCIGPSNIN